MGKYKVDVNQYELTAQKEKILSSLLPQITDTNMGDNKIKDAYIEKAILAGVDISTASIYYDGEFTKGYGMAMRLEGGGGEWGIMPKGMNKWFITMGIMIFLIICMCLVIELVFVQASTGFQFFITHR